MILLVNSLKELKYDYLPFNPRWKISYYNEKEVIQEDNHKMEDSKRKKEIKQCLKEKVKNFIMV